MVVPTNASRESSHLQWIDRFLLSCAKSMKLRKTLVNTMMGRESLGQRERKNLPNNVQLLPTLRLSRLRRVLFRPPNVVCWPDELSTSTPHPGCALADRHRTIIYHLTMKLTDTPNTAIDWDRSIKQDALCDFHFFFFSVNSYHITIMMTQQDCIAVQQCSMARSCSFALRSIVKSTMLKF